MRYMPKSSAIGMLLHDPVRVGQVFLVSRHAGVLLGAVVIARQLDPLSVGGLEKLMLCGYLMTFFWTEALLKGFLSQASAFRGDDIAAGFLGLIMAGSLTAMAILVLGSPILIPFFTGTSRLDGLGLFALYQALVVPLWLAPFTGVLRGLDPWLLSAYVLVGPAFSAWIGLGQLGQPNGVLIGWLSYALVGLAWVLIKTPSRAMARPWQVGRAVWPIAWPLMLFAVSAGLARSFDAWWIAHTEDDSAFAVFRYGAREFPWVMALTAGFSTTMIGVLASGGPIRELYARSARLMHAVLPVVGATMLASPILFPLVFGEAYADSARIFNIYLLLALTQVVFPQAILTARGETRVLWHVSLVELAVNILLSIPLYYLLGMPGVAWGTLIAFTVEKIILFIWVNRKCGIAWRDIFPVGVWLGYAIVLTGLFVLSAWIR